MFKDKTSINQNIQDLNIAQDKKEARINWIKHELTRLSDEQNKMIEEATQDLINYTEELRRPLIEELQQLESQAIINTTQSK